jgi:hypothetical protein
MSLTLDKNTSSLIGFLRDHASVQEAKAIRNGRKYYNSTNFYAASLRDNTPLGWNYEDYSYDKRSGVTPKVNIAKSAVDTLCARISNQKVRPIFTPRDGSFSTRRAIQAIQNYFDDLFYSMNVNRLVTKAFRYGCLFDAGVLFVNPLTKKLEALPSWEVGIINSEAHYNNIFTTCLIRKMDFPTTLLDDYGIKLPQAKNRLYVDLELFFDAKGNRAIILIDHQPYKQVHYHGSRAPVIFLYFNEPLVGGRTSSLFDDLLPIQQQIDSIITKIKDASNSTPLNTIFAPDGSELNIQLLDNGAGNIIHYRPVPGVTDPIKVATPNPIDPFYLGLYQTYKEDAFNMAGVSEMSAVGESPSHLNSGEALKTMENIESSRWDTQLAQVIRAYVQIAQLYIDVYDEKEEVLPPDKLRDEITWGDVKKHIDNVSIQFTAASALSNDPEKQIQLLKELSQLGYIKEYKISDYIDLPDVRKAFNEAGAIVDAVDKVIQNVLEPDKDDPENYHIPIFLDYETLREEILSLQNQFYSMSGDHQEQIGRLQKLYMILQPLIEEAGIDAPPVEEGAGDDRNKSDSGFMARGMIGGDDLSYSGADSKKKVGLSGDGMPLEDTGTPGVSPATASPDVDQQMGII